jgi:hypothetical protein
MDKKLESDHKVNKNIFLAALLFLLIFIVAGYSGIMLYDSHKKDTLEYDYSLLNQQVLLNDLYDNYLADINSQSEKCAILVNQLDSQLKVNKELFERLKLINENAIVESDNNLKYTYVLTNIKLWLHYNKINRDCENVDLTSILYFYPEIVGNITERAKLDAKTNVFQHKLREFGTNCDYDSFALPYLFYIPIVDQIIHDYNVIKGPAAVVNGKIIYEFPKDMNAEFYANYGCILKENK